MKLSTMEQVAIEKRNYVDRQLRRLTVKVGTSAAILFATYVAYNARKCFKELGNQLSHVGQRIAVVENAVEASRLSAIKSSEEQRVQNSTKLVDRGSGFNPASWLVNGTKNFAIDIGRCVVDTFPSFISGMVFTTLWQQICNRIVDASRQESLLWYVEQHTQLLPLFHDLTMSCIPYDLWSELLSLQQVHDKATNQMNAYVADLSELKEGARDGFLGDEYFDFSREALKKNHAKNGSELAQLQNYAAPNIAKRKRAIEKGLHGGTLFEEGDAGKQNIVDLCTMLAEQIQQLLSFAMMHMENRHAELPKATTDRGRKRIDQIIVITNNYLEHIERLLNMNYEELESMSVTNRGMFTMTYEFERLLKEHVSILHRYCMLIK